MEDLTLSGETPSIPEPSVIDNTARHRFELDVDGQTAFADYRREPGRLIVLHVETPPALRGGGVAARLMQGLLQSAREEGVKVTPLCAYASAFIRRHVEYQDLAG
jgi:predicted GNAT family acetyltransferase